MEFYTLIEVPKESDRKGIAFGVMVPCLPGCFSAGDTMEAAIENAQEAITMYIEDLLERGEPVPRSHPLDVVNAKRRQATGLQYASMSKKHTYQQKPPG